MSTLHSTINSLASEFAHSLLRAVRGASLEEILAETAPGHAGGGARRGRPAAAAAHTTQAAPARRGGRRLRRRTATDIQAVVGKMVTLLKSNKKGLRAEDIREKLHLDRREVPRPLAEALKKKLVTKKGKKRATTYYAA
ncbi:MAG TPA: hypothetical protein VGH28_11455 [Polyangiaceae bacterium]|jgi:hypothetical protein